MRYDFGTVAMPVKATEHDIRAAIAPILNIPLTSFRVEIVGRRLFFDKGKLLIDNKVIVETNEFIRNTSIHFHKEEEEERIRWKRKESPIIIGGGLSGLSCAYYLALAGANPILLEQGDDLGARNISLSPLRGLGGRLAGLGSSFSSISGMEILSKDFATLGLPKRVFAESYGVLTAKDVQLFVRKLRDEIVRLGGNVLCASQAMKIKTFFGWPKEVFYLHNGGMNKMPAKYIVLATGHGEFVSTLAKDNALSLVKSSKYLTVFTQNKKSAYAKTFFRGVNGMDLPYLDASCSFRTKDDRRVHFEGGLPYSAIFNGPEKDGQINLCAQLGDSTEILSKLSLEVKESELGYIEDLLMHLNQREKPYAIPAESLSDFQTGKEPFRLHNIYPIYEKGLYLCNLRDILPDSMGDSIRYAFSVLEKKMPFFMAPESLVFGFELTRGGDFVAKCIQEGKTNLRSVYSALPTSKENDNPLSDLERGRRAALCLLQDV